ncbi:hypothetical protein [Bacillus phage phiAGATE]|uniref:Uncharacterized protein n=1 Tax=Bacillus phage phiAGATE TaxID=1204533 RepID=L0LBZ3_9CAUD|nr:hypothetical protein G380_gp035 [Bacillus phage phiAGATE]AGB62685.1 hypothetical protein [Bacillus phage phiAGATE]
MKIKSRLTKLTELLPSKKRAKQERAEKERQEEMLSILNSNRIMEDAAPHVDVQGYHTSKTGIHWVEVSNSVILYKFGQIQTENEVILLQSEVNRGTVLVEYYAYHSDNRVTYLYNLANCLLMVIKDKEIIQLIQYSVPKLDFEKFKRAAQAIDKTIED